MAYIDGFVIPVRTASKQAYRGFDVLVDTGEGLK